MNDFTSFTDKQDDFLVEMTLLGSNKAYEELVIRYEKKVKGTAYKITKNKFSAEDASQDAFVCAWVKLSSLKDAAKFGSWLCSIAKNCAVNLVRHYCNTSIEVSYELLKNMDIESSLDANIAKALEQDRDDRLHEAVEALSEKISETVKLHYFEGLSMEEISEKLNIPLGTVKWRLSEGRKQLRKEYGVMEENKNATFVEKVMYQVEQLKLWGLKNDKTGFEKEYRLVLKNVEKLEESKEKQNALAEVLARGYWWLDKEQNEEVFGRIKTAAEKSHNEVIMSFVVDKERNDHEKNGGNKAEYMEKVQIPYLIRNGFTKTLGYIYFWLAYYLCRQSEFEKGIGYFKKVLETLTKKDIYYAVALGAIYIEEKMLKEGVVPSYVGTTAEELQYKDGKLYFTNQPGYSNSFNEKSCSIFNASCMMDSVIFDESLKEGESALSSDGTTKITCKGSNYTVDTPAGKYENCICYLAENMKGDYDLYNYCETYFRRGVGIVKQSVSNHGRAEWLLSKCVIKGGDEIIPFAEGNRWEYCIAGEEDEIYDSEIVYEIVFAENGKALLSHYDYQKLIGFNENTWRGNILKARRTYWDESEDCLSKNPPSYEKAEKLAKTKREKLHTSIAKNVMERIYNTEPDYNPDYTQKGFRNFFGYHYLTFREGKIIITGDRQYEFESKSYDYDDEFGKIVYDYFYEELCSLTGTAWSDNWVPGYEEKEEVSDSGKKLKYSLKVLEEETVTTKACEFKNCRHIRIEERSRNLYGGYMNGIREFWFAPEIGIVKYLRKYKNDALDAIWELTEYKGRGQGYFPVEDALFRRYEPQNLTNGWHGSVEYTFDKDETDAVIFKNTLGTRDREYIEK